MSTQIPINPAPTIDMDRMAVDKMSKGIHALCMAVGSTLGPCGSFVVIKEGARVYATKDGVTVAGMVSFDDPAMDAGASLVRQAAARTNSECGDGTTTATVLAWSIVDGFNHSSINISHATRMHVEGIVDNACKSIMEMAREASEADLMHIATVSANGDKRLGKIISNAVITAGRDGAVLVEETKLKDTSMEVVEGMGIERGWTTEQFLPVGGEVILKNPFVLVTDTKVKSAGQVAPYLSHAKGEGRSLLVIAPDVEGEAAQVLVTNNHDYMKDGKEWLCASVKAPGHAEDMNNRLADIAKFTGAKVISSSTGLSLDGAHVRCLGGAKSVVVKRDSTLIQDGHGSPREIEDWKDAIRHRLKDKLVSQMDKDLLKERLAALSAVNAIIRVGGSSQVEQRERMDRVVDAINATKSAMTDGIIPGGGAALALTAMTLREPAQHDPVLAIMVGAMKRPMEWIMENAGTVLPEIELTPTTTVDAMTMKVVDAFESGIIDPAKVACTALRNAASVAMQVVSSKCVISR